MRLGPLRRGRDAIPRFACRGPDMERPDGMIRKPRRPAALLLPGAVRRRTHARYLPSAAARIAANSAALAWLCFRSLAFGMAELSAITRWSSG